MTNQSRIKVGKHFWDWQVNANVEVVEVNANHIYPKCKIEATGATYYARADALEEPRD